jgi:hypothetical protein
MIGDGVYHVDSAGVDDGAGVHFLDVGLISAFEGGGHEEVAWEEDRERDCQPFETYKHDRVDLISVMISYFL